MKAVPGAEAEDDRWIATYVGGLDASKRIDVLIHVAQCVHGIDSRFLLVIGGRGDMEEEVKNAAENPWLEYVKQVDDYAKALIASRAYVMLIPGRVGLAAIDSFVMETPIGVMEYEFHAPEFEYLTASSSVVVENNEDSYVSAIVELMNDPELFTNLTRNARADARKYLITDMVEKFAFGINSALDENRSPKR